MNMKLPVSEKTSSFTRPHIRKGYYPGKLLKVEEFKDQNGTLKEGKYGRQLIFQFAVYHFDQESGAPTRQMRFMDDNMNTPVELSKFVYHQYKNDHGEYKTAITPKSAITKLLMALGWTFTAEGIDTDSLIGNWAELNVDDYEKVTQNDTIVMSTIKDVSPYKGPEPARDEGKSDKGPKPSVESRNNTSKENLEKIRKLKELKDSGELSDEGFQSAVEQLES